jgi:hypothetical protein
MLSHEMHMRTIVNDRHSAQLKEAEVHRFAKKNQRSSSALATTGKVALTVRHAVSDLLAARSSAINARRALS